MALWEQLNGNQRLAGGVFGLLSLFAMGYFGQKHLQGRPDLVSEPLSQEAAQKPAAVQGLVGDTQSTSPKEVVIDVSGAVAKPGVYRLPANARVFDALKAAGGTLPGAEYRHLNRAAKLVDGSQIVIPMRQAADPLPGPRTADRSPARRSARPNPMEGMIPPVTVQPLAAYQSGTSKEYQADDPPARANPPRTGKKPTNPSPVNLNSATQAQLETLPGVGPATARKILDYRRAHGGFSSVEELLAVSGIGEKKLAQMRPFVRL